jgi:hypothetical protein
MQRLGRSTRPHICMFVLLLPVLLRCGGDPLLLLRPPGPCLCCWVLLRLRAGADAGVWRVLAALSDIPSAEIDAPAAQWLPE